MSNKIGNNTLSAMVQQTPEAAPQAPLPEPAPLSPQRSSQGTGFSEVSSFTQGQTAVPPSAAPAKAAAPAIKDAPAAQQAPDTRSKGQKFTDALLGIGLDLGLGLLTILGGSGKGGRAAGVVRGAEGIDSTSGFVNPFSNWRR